MKNFTLEQKEELYDLSEQGAQVAFVSYDPNTTDGDPEADAIAAGLAEYYREDSDDLVEVIYIPEEFALEPGTLALSSDAYTVLESDGTAVITITRQDGSDGAISVRLTTSDGTATAGEDYTAVDTVVEWEDGDDEDKTVEITISNDSDVESDETVIITLSDVTGDAELGLSEATLTIINDDEDDGGESGVMTLLVKQSDTTRTGSSDGTTPFADSELVFENLQPGYYHIEGCFYFSGSDVTEQPNVRVGFNCSAAPDGSDSRSGFGYDIRQSTSYATGRPTFINGNNNSNHTFISPNEVVYSTTAHLSVTDPITVSMIWSTNANNTAPLTLKAGSWITITGPFS